MNREDALKQSDKALQELANALNQGKSDVLMKYLDMLANFHRYSFCNCMLIALQKPDATFAAGFHGWKKLGRSVKKGETGIMILAPIVYRNKKPRNTTSDEREEPKDRKSSLLRGFRAVYVFDISQTEGKEIAEFARLQGDPGENIARLEAIIRAKGIEFERTDALDGANGVSCGGKIKVLTSLPPPQMFSTMAHELAHELLHRGDRREQMTTTIRETEAEAVAYVVCRASGLECSTRAADYIQLYNGDASTLMQSLELIRSVATQIICELEIDSASETQASEVAHA